MSVLDNIKQITFPETGYFRQEYAKTQVCLHHTVSGPGVMGDVNYWIQRAAKISTPIIVDRTGDIYQCYSTKYWGYHLGVRDEDIIESGISNYHRLDYNCIGVEIDSWGGLVQDKTTSLWHPALWDKKKKKLVPNTDVKAIENVVEYPDGFRGFYGFEKYTDEQIESTKQLLLFWNKSWGIPLQYNEDMFELNSRALSGESGIWTHTSYRLDKSDCHPQEELITMLKSLTE
jgi:hypothetical protein